MFGLPRLHFLDPVLPAVRSHRARDCVGYLSHFRVQVRDFLPCSVVFALFGAQCDICSQASSVRLSCVAAEVDSSSALSLEMISCGFIPTLSIILFRTDTLIWDTMAFATVLISWDASWFSSLSLCVGGWSSVHIKSAASSVHLNSPSTFRICLH